MTSKLLLLVQLKKCLMIQLQILKMRVGDLSFTYLLLTIHQCLC
jgi:hypothetical protein